MAGRLQLVGDEIWVDGVKVAVLSPGHYPEKTAFVRLILSRVKVRLPALDE